MMLEEGSTAHAVVGDLGVFRCEKGLRDCRGLEEEGDHLDFTLLPSRGKLPEMLEGVLFSNVNLMGPSVVLGSDNGPLDTLVVSKPTQRSPHIGLATSALFASQNSMHDSEDTISNFSNQEEFVLRRRCKKKLYKNHNFMMLGNSRCM